MNRTPRCLLASFACLALLAAGCVEQESDDQPAEAAAGTAEQTPSDGSEEPSSADTLDVVASGGGACNDAPGVTDDEVKLAVLTDLSGPVAAGGIPWSQGAQAYFDNLNAEDDGLNGREIVLEIADHGYDPQAAIQRYNEVEADVLAIPLSFGSAMNNAIGGELPNDCMPLVANNGSITDVQPNLFYNASAYETQVLNGIDWYLRQGNESPRVAIFYQGDVYGQGALEALEYAAEERGFEIVSAQSYAIGDQSYAGQLAAISDAEPDLVMMASTVGATFGFFGEAQASGAEWDWLGLQPTFAPAVFGLPIADAYVSDWVISTGQPIFDQGGPATEEAFEVLSGVSEELANDPSSLLGWQAAFLLHQALLEADASEEGLTRGSVLTALATLDVTANGLGPGTFTYDPDSPQPGVPYDESSIVRINPETPGFLSIVEPYTTSDLVAGWLEQL